MILANSSAKSFFLARIIRSISWRNCSVHFLFPLKVVGLAIAGPLDSAPPGFVNIVSGGGSGSPGGSGLLLGVSIYPDLRTWSNVGVQKSAWRVVSCKGDIAGVFPPGILLPLAVSPNRVYMCGLGKSRCLFVGDSGLLKVFLAM